MIEACEPVGAGMSERGRGEGEMLKELLIKLIKIYQKISSLTPPVCRFTPTCSEYTKQAIEKYGILKGLWLGLKRVCKCHPFHPGGYDPLK